MIMDNHLLPHMDELFSLLRGAMVFLTVDLQSGYHQVLLHLNSHKGLLRLGLSVGGISKDDGSFEMLTKYGQLFRQHYYMGTHI